MREHIKNGEYPNDLRFILLLYRKVKQETDAAKRRENIAYWKNELQERVRKCGDDVNAIIEISTEMHKYNCRICPRNMYQDETSKAICPALRGKPCRRDFAVCWRAYFKKKNGGGK